MKRAALLFCLTAYFCSAGTGSAITCTTDTRRGSLVAIYVRGEDVHLSIKAPGLGNNPGECLTAPYTCETILCGDEADCKSTPPLGHCVDVLVTQCIEGTIRELAYASSIDFVSVGACP